MSEDENGGDGRRNVVLITVDSLRADHCGWLNGELDLTPALDAMARSGVSFEDAVAPGPSTHDSMPEVFSGRRMFPSRSGIEKREDIVAHLRKTRPIPVWMSDRGYSTAAFTPNVYTSRHFGYDRGFDTFVDFLDRSSVIGRLRGEAVSRWSDGGLAGGLRFVLNMSGVGEEAISWRDFYGELVETVGDLAEPFFLWVFLMEPHWPYHPSARHRGNIGLAEMFKLNWKASMLSDSDPSPAETERLRRLYEGAIRDVDDFVRELRADLGEYDPAYVFHADHGEAFGERGRFGHGRYLYEENLHVPLVVGNVDATERVREPVTLRRLPEAVSLLSERKGSELSTLSDRTVGATEEGGGECVRGREWKVYRHRDGDTTCHGLAGVGPEPEGVDVSDDPVLTGLVDGIERHRTETAAIEDGARAVTRNGLEAGRR
jgi:arylsulfatase